MGESPIRAVDLTGGQQGEDDETFRPPSAETLEASTPLAELRKVLEQEVVRQPVTLEVPARNGMSVTYDTNIQNDKMEEWRKRAKRPRGRGEFDLDPVKLACIVLANQARAIQMHGRQVFDEQGSPMLFSSRELAESLVAQSGWDCVRRLYGVDGHCIAAAEEVISAAGYGEGINEAADPT